MMPTLKSILATALSYSLFTASSVSALQLQQTRLQLQTQTARDRNHISFGAALQQRHGRISYCGRNNGVISQHGISLLSHRQDRQEDDPSESNEKNINKSDDDDEQEDDESEEESVNMNDWVDFESMGKVFDDLPVYGSIRSLESPYENYNPIEPVSVEEMESWMEKNNLQEKEQQKKRLWRKLFPWVSPLTSLLLPKKHSPSSEKPSQSRIKISKRLHSNFNNGLSSSSPRYLRSFISTPNAARNLIAGINIVAFIYQIITAVWYLPGFNRILAASVAGDASSAAALTGGLSNIPQWTPMEVVMRALGLGGSSVVIASGSRMRGAMPIAAHSLGPLFIDFAHQPYPLSHFQKHRYVSSGFLHGSLLHLGMNLRALLSLPSWLENGIGKGVYLSAYLGAIVTGNIAHTMSSVGGRGAASLCVGASGGICGLYGLMLSSLLKMGNADTAYFVMKQMVWLAAFGFLVPNVSNAAHVGGFVGGFLVGYLFGPGYERSYTLSRGSDGTSRDSADWEFRQMLGHGIYPSEEKAFFPLKYLWMGIGATVLARQDLRQIPLALLKGALYPGALSGTRALLR
mmetsp:Transcript_17476/g.37779  ORF Transcript_17476/g.37779 Transcript_17476/m.37779 type:complete len:574 (+) Transcript_17476:119-1840(+)